MFLNTNNNSYPDDAINPDRSNLQFDEYLMYVEILCFVIIIFARATQVFVSHRA